MSKFNHAVTIAFTIISSNEDGSDITREQFVAANMKRLSNILMDSDEGETLEIFDIFDTYKEV